MAERAFSAKVSLTLEVEGRVIQLGQVGPDFVIVRGTYDRIEPQAAVLVVQIDERIHRTDVRLTDAIEGEYSRVRYERCEVAAAS